MISVVIPTYNDEKTIIEALNSVKFQSYKNFEIIIVNDCSIDKTSELINEYKEKNKELKITILNNSKNKGVGISRKLGFEATHGEFVTFLDADDYFLENFLNNSLIFHYLYNADVVYTSVICRFKYNKGMPDIKINRGDLHLENNATITIFLDKQIKFFTGAIFTKRLLHKIEFSPKRIGEDTLTLFYALYEANSVRITSYGGYIHTYRPGSLLYSQEMALKILNSEIVDQEICDFLYKKNDIQLLKSYIPLVVSKRNNSLSTLLSGNKPCDGTVSIMDLYKQKELWDKYEKWFVIHENFIKSLGLNLIKFDLEKEVKKIEIKNK